MKMIRRIVARMEAAKYSMVDLIAGSMLVQSIVRGEWVGIVYVLLFLIVMAVLSVSTRIE